MDPLDDRRLIKRAMLPGRHFDLAGLTVAFLLIGSGVGGAVIGSLFYTSL